MKKPVEDNKTAKAEAKVAIVHAAVALGTTYLTSLESEVLTEVLFGDLTFKEIGEVRQLSASRVRTIFGHAHLRLLSVLKKMGERVSQYDELHDKYTALFKQQKAVQVQRTKEDDLALALSKLAPKTRELLEKPISETILSARVKNICSYNDIIRLSDLVKLNPSRLLQFRNCGGNAIAEIQDFFEDNDLRWGMI